MCTVTWTFRDRRSYDLFFNRDELRSRPRAHPPAVHRASGARFVAATDPQGGGTWLACNEFGLSVGLLNLYPPHSEGDALPDHADPATHHHSRGLLVLSLADAPTRDEIARRIDALDVDGFRPFLLFCLAPDRASSAVMWSWNGVRLESVPPELPLTTSSFESEAVVAYRRDQYRKYGPERLENFHRSCDPGRRAHSVFMARPDARTVSLSRVSVAPEGVRYRYWEPTPDSTGLEPVADLLLAPVFLT